MSFEINDEEIEAAGKDVKAITKIARKLHNASKELDRLGVYVFGSSGQGTIRFNDGKGGPLVLAHIGHHFDGGDGACNTYRGDGLLRGE